MQFEIYKDAAGEYRWRLRAGNGKIMADSGEGYAERHNAVSAINAIKNAVFLARVCDVDA